jgi:hypothetical protein
VKWLLIAVAALAATPALAQSAVSQFEAARAAPLTAGSWLYRPTASGSESRFGTRFLISCNRASRTVAIQRLDSATSSVGPLVIATDTLARTLPAGGASLRANDPLLDAIAFSRGRFIVTGDGGEMLVLPAWPEAARSIEDCRN